MLTDAVILLINYWFFKCYIFFMFLKFKNCDFVKLKDLKRKNSYTEVIVLPSIGSAV